MRKRSEAKRDREEEQKVVREWVLDVPNDPITEQVILATMFANLEECDRLRPLCSPDGFYAKPHRRIRAVIELARLRGHSLDPAVLARLDPDVDVPLIERIIGARPDVPEDVDLHVEHFRYDAERAKFAQGPAQAMLEALQDPKAPREKLRSIARQIGDFFTLEMGKGRYLRKTEHVIDEAMRAIDARTPGVSHPFGLKGLDYTESGECRLRPGAAPGELTVLTGSTGSGKTSLLAHLVLGLARQKKRVLMGAWEVRAPMTMEMLAIFSLGWSRSRFLDGYSGKFNEEKIPISKEDKEIIRERMKAIGRWIVFMDNPVEKDLDDATNAQIVEVLEEHVEASGCDVATWDLLDRAYNETDPSAEKALMRRVLRLGDRRQIHQIMVHQQNMKGLNVREDARPTLKGVMGSSAFTQDAGLVIAPYMPSRHKDVPETTIEVIGLKQRYGPPFGVEFEWEPARGSLTGGRSFNPMMMVADETLGPVSKSFPAQKKRR
jgi:replicative DNA helicase